MRQRTRNSGQNRCNALLPAEDNLRGGGPISEAEAERRVLGECKENPRTPNRGFPGECVNGGPEKRPKEEVPDPDFSTP